MYKTGDLLKNIEKLKIELKQIKYPEKIEVDCLTEGNPLFFLPILHFSLLSYSKHVAEYLLENQYELFSKSDKEFVNKIFKAMIELFNYKPTLNPRQFFMSGYAEAKVIFCLEVIRLVKLEHNKLLKKAFSVSVKNTNASTLNKNKSKLNDSYRSNKSTNSNISNLPARDDFLDYSSNDRVKVVNHQKSNLRKELDVSLKNEIDVQMASPKFNDDEKIEYNGRSGSKKYNFNQNFTKNLGVKNGKNNCDQLPSKINQDEVQIYSNNTKHNNNILPASDIFDKEKDEYKEQPKQSQNFSSVIEIINSLASSIRDMTIKIDTFKNSIEDRVSKLEAEISLVKNKVHIIESNCSNKTAENKSIQNITNNGNKISMSISESYSNSNMLNQSSIENNEHIFSFADDQLNVVNTLHNQELFNKVEHNHINHKYSTLSAPQNRSTINQIGTSNFSSTNHNQQIPRTQNNSQQSFQNNQVSPQPFMNKISTKILTDIEDTDSIIQKVANRFKETQKLLNEFK